MLKIAQKQIKKADVGNRVEQIIEGSIEDLSMFEDEIFDTVLRAQVKALSLPSGVKAFPTSDEETLRGAMNRAEKARSLEPGADFAVGIEGGLDRLEGHVFIHQIAVVIKGGTKGIGISQGYIAPDRLIEQLDME